MDMILASQSPRRKELLGQMGLRGFKVTSPEVDETVDEHLPPAQVVEELSRRKAMAVARHADGDDLIIAADTVVALEGAVLGKPADQREAFAMLTALSGNRHYVYTGLTVIQGDRVVTQHECTTVTFRDLEPEEISHYIATGEPMDKARRGPTAFRVWAPCWCPALKETISTWWACPSSGSAGSWRASAWTCSRWPTTKREDV